MKFDEESDTDEEEENRKLQLLYDNVPQAFINIDSPNHKRLPKVD